LFHLSFVCCEFCLIFPLFVNLFDLCFICLDAVLSLVTTIYFFHHHPEYTEGELHLTKAENVCNSRLAAIGRRVDLGNRIFHERFVPKCVFSFIYSTYTSSSLRSLFCSFMCSHISRCVIKVCRNGWFLDLAVVNQIN
jgi:hypothetical protein